MRNRLKLEQVLISIEVHGDPFDHIDTIRDFRKNEWTSYAQVEAALRDVGWSTTEIRNMISERHEGECVCWDCVMALHNEIVQGIARRQVLRVAPARRRA